MEKVTIPIGSRDAVPGWLFIFDEASVAALDLSNKVPRRRDPVAAECLEAGADAPVVVEASRARAD